MNVTIVTGPRDSGKTSWLLRQFYLSGGVGIIMVKNFQDGIHCGYDGLILPTMQRIEICRLKTVQTPVSKKWEFHQQAFDSIRSIINILLQNNHYHNIIIDEIGSLELCGDGFTPLLCDIIRSHPQANLYLGIRQNLLPSLTQKFNLTHGISATHWFVRG